MNGAALDRGCSGKASHLVLLMLVLLLQPLRRGRAAAPCDNRVYTGMHAVSLSSIWQTGTLLFCVSGF